MQYVKLVSDTTAACSRCGTTSGVMLDAEGAILVDDDGEIVCPNCMTYAENRDNGRRILAELEAQADVLRRQWLGDDYDELSLKKRRKRGKRRPKPDALGPLIAQIEEVENTLEAIEDEFRFRA